MNHFLRISQRVSTEVACIPVISCENVGGCLLAAAAVIRGIFKGISEGLGLARQTLCNPSNLFLP